MEFFMPSRYELSAEQWQKIEPLRQSDGPWADSLG